MTSNDTIGSMAKRTFIQVEASEEWKAEFQKQIGEYMPMAAELRRLAEEKYPSLKTVQPKTLLTRLKEIGQGFDDEAKR